MPRRPQERLPEDIRNELIDLLYNFKQKLKEDDLRIKVVALIPAFHLLRDLGSSLIPRQDASAARDRILCYFLKYPLTVLHSDEILVVSGIQEYARRIRELRREMGWSIASGMTITEMSAEGELTFQEIGVDGLKPEEYILMSVDQDREAAFRWNLANEIRRSKAGIRDKILEFMRKNVGRRVTGEELRYLAKDKTEWARRIRELRTEYGWPIVTKNTGRPDLDIGVYVLEEDRQSPAHDRNIPDPVRRQVLVRDEYICRECGWSHNQWNPSDPRHLELHHKKHHAEGGDNTAANLITLCTVCHDELHRKWA